jgi:hypothetical protein
MPDDYDNFYHNCDSCNKCLNICSFYYRSIDDFDICDTCFNDFKFDIIDRTEYSVEQKPLIWPCFMCKTKLGGGFKWYNKKEIDLCSSCHDTKDYHKKLQKNMTFVDFSKKSDYKLSDYSEIFDMTKPQHTVTIEDLKIEGLEGTEIIEEEDKYEDYFMSSLKHLEIDDCKLYDYTPFTNICEVKTLLPTSHADYNFFVNNNLDSPYYKSVAICLYDNHSRMYLKKLFKHIQEYNDMYNDWKSGHKEPQEKDKEMLEEVYKLGVNATDESIDKVIPFVDNFGGYCVLKFNMPTYYG